MIRTELKERGIPVGKISNLPLAYLDSWFVGPYSQLEAAEIVEALLDSNGLKTTLLEALTGKIGQKEFLYELQVMADSIAALKGERS